MKKIVFVITVVLIALTACKKEKSSENDILFFSLAQQTGDAIINKESHIVISQVAFGTDLSQLAPEIVLSDGASSIPESGQITDFSQGSVVYRVIAEDNSVQEWSVTVDAEKSSAAQILSFTIDLQTKASVLTDSTVQINMPSGTDLTVLKPVILVSPGATVTPESGTTIDFSQGSVVFTVTASDGTQKTWSVTVTRSLNTESNLKTFTVSNQIGLTARNGRTLYLEVPYSTDLTAIIPEITISDFATITPAIGQAVDFSSGPVNYKVTSESGVSLSYTVYVNHLLIPADNVNIQYVGRIDFTNPKKPKFWNAGVFVKAKYTGTYCEVAFYDEILWGTSKNYFEIVIDDTLRYHLQSTSDFNNFRVGDGLPYGEHKILFCKDTEQGIGYLEFLGFRAESLVAPEALPTKKIEFIGNSITCGSGIDESIHACNTGEWYGQHNAYMSYGPRVARKLNAQWMLSSVSGIGLIQSCCNMTTTMPQVYGKIGLNTTSGDWDFSKYIADAVTICLGQNDGIQDSTAFCSAYIDFISAIRTKYANADIICMTSPMADNSLFESQKKYLSSIVAKAHTGGDNKVYYLELSHALNSGCQSHPDMNQHEQIALEIETFFTNTLGW